MNNKIPDFDRIIDRSNSPAEKWNKPAMLRLFGRDDLLPFWVADMEFQVPNTVQKNLVSRAKNGIFGYEYKQDSLYQSIIQWYAIRHHWKIDRSHLCFSRGILNAIATLINIHTEEGDGIIIQPPVFFEFRLIIRDNNRNIIRNPLKIVDGKYGIDYDDLEEKASDSKTKMLILCNPHNPVSRVWTKDELKRVGEICLRHNVFIVTDEIHGDFVFNGHHYTPFASISIEIAQNSVTCISPAKTFNIAAVTDGFVIIPNEKYREQYNVFTKRLIIHKTNAFSVVAIETAYRSGSEWLDHLLDYLQDNINYIRTYLGERIPKVKLVNPEGTFLIWLDFRQLGMDVKELESFLAQKAGIALNSGYWFGRQGAGYARMTIACPKSMIVEGL
ncbi:MAG: pyridoxal phosphate-dependent aminotransferase, partial [Candidatus Marinimicrobia bacterium]|nr:pyridoxal phosphate-dependent aminotransferase [Candidatus Neomarinimicrobiota bacterium]